MRKHLHFFILLLSITMVFVAAGCSPMARLGRLQRNHSYLFRNDTITVNDTLIVPARSIDHKAALPVGKDTVIIFRNHQSKMSGRLQLRYVYDTVKVEIEAETMPDTIKYQKSIFINQQPLIPIERKRKSDSLALAMIAGIGLFLLITYILKR